MTILERIRINLEENGIEISEDGSLVNVDSMSFISSIVCIEQEFEIEFPDGYLLIEEMSNIESLNYIVTQIISDQFCD
ncbi:MULTISPECIES: acyl carrier protein [Paenibacillus sonchi group]|jgi:acyl carrier protein|uniref:Carrier domain-containing protein n=1 Tax=Paenibacillus riograndensis TaxID=483937 RepID=A0A132TW66_9BACL|nr:MULTISPECIES: phosphopantetheine-binding protein [Paenibacillus sonchi group]KWX75484.1 hypothetical protein AMQ84_17850 [Paenibacillus riograndensis]MCE3203134.1 hypothetical protein [Paenibacillus sonchi]